MYNMVRNIRYKQSRPSDFQCNLTKDLKEIKNSSNLYVPADKTANVYKVSADQYQQLLLNNITASYKKAASGAKVDIDREAKAIARDLGLEDRIECLAKRDAFITLKDHKENFPNNTKCRLHNPTKS